MLPIILMNRIIFSLSTKFRYNVSTHNATYRTIFKEDIRFGTYLLLNFLIYLKATSKGSRFEVSRFLEIIQPQLPKIKELLKDT
jgi:hypothetical protein